MQHFRTMKNTRPLRNGQGRKHGRHVARPLDRDAVEPRPKPVVVGAVLPLPGGKDVASHQGLELGQGHATQFTPGAIVVIRGGDTSAAHGQKGMGYRAPAVAKLVRLDGDFAVIQRVGPRYGRHIRWGRPGRIPAANVVRLASPRELVLGYPAMDGPPLRVVTR